MAEDDGGSGGAKVLTDPKNRKMLAVGVVILGMIVAYMLFRRGKSSAQSGAVTSPNATNQAAIATPVVPGSSDSMSAADYLAQFAGTVQADQNQLNTMWGNQFAALQGEIGSLAAKPDNDTTVIVGDNDHDHPPVPPVHVPTPGKPPTVDPNITVKVLPWNSTTSDMINGHPWQSTLWGIGQHYHESWPTIWKANPGIHNPNLIYPGQVINVPDPNPTPHTAIP